MNNDTSSIDSIPPIEQLISDFPRFWSKVRFAESDECWEWQASIFKKRGGYGQFSYKLKPHYAHRIAWILVYGEITDELCVLHECDNPLCVNPHHLFLGTRAVNNADMKLKGRERHRTPVGEGNPNNRLTEIQVLEIRRLKSEGLSSKEIARRFDIGKDSVNRLVRRAIWKHI